METKDKIRDQIFEIIENQLRENNPPETKQTYDRLISEGFAELETRKMIGQCLSLEMFEVIKFRRKYNNTRYIENLKNLPQKPFEQIMRIELTKKQYKTLLTVMFCGEWMLNSQNVNENKLSNETDDLEQLIFSFAKESGIEKWIEYDEELNKYFPTASMEDDLHLFIDKYNLQQKR